MIPDSITARPLENGDIQQILVFRPNAVGDFVFALPCLWSLRAAYPSARIVYVGLGWHSEFLSKGRTPVDEVLVLPRCAGINAHVDDPMLAQFIESIRNRSFDIALQVYGGGRIANPLVKRFGARSTIGLHTQGAPALDQQISHAPLQNRRLQLLEVAGLAGAPPVMPVPELLVMPEDRRAVADLLHTIVYPFALLNPGASDPRRRWSPSKFAAVGDHLASRGVQVLVHGLAAEAPLCQAVISAMRSPAVDLSGCVSLGGLCAVLEQASLLVSNDTGPLHLATALRTPAVGLYWRDNLVESLPLQQHWHRAAWDTNSHCPVCGSINIDQRCAHDVSFVDGVPVEQVLALSDALLAMATTDATARYGPAKTGMKPEPR